MSFLKRIITTRAAKIFLCILGAFLLLFLIKSAFFDEKSAENSVKTEEEARICAILQEIDGVDSAEILVSRKDSGRVSAVVVYRGEDSLMTRNHIVSVVENALQAECENVLVYSKQTK